MHNSQYIQNNKIISNLHIETSFAYYINLSAIYIKDFSDKIIFKEENIYIYRTNSFKILENYKSFSNLYFAAFIIKKLY